MHPANDPMSRWLEAERDGRAEDAEAALFEVFELLPPLAPSAGFADRVLRQVALQSPATARSSLFRSRGFRLVLASCLLAVGISLFWLPRALAALAGIVTVGDLVQVGVASAIDLGRWLLVIGGIGEWFVTVLEALAVSLTSPAALRLTAACLAVSGVSFVFLRDLMTRNRSWSYVDSAQ
jgi:hypothetical protein